MIGAQLNGDFNSFYQTQIGIDVGLCFDITGEENTINGLCGDGGAAKVITQGLNISGTRNLIANVAFLQLHEWGVTISGNNNHLVNVVFSTIDEEGFIISGNENILTGCSSIWVGVDAGEACNVTGDKNQIFGGDFNGPGTKTIVFTVGADNNRVVSAQVTKAIINSGTDNKFWEVQGYVTENSGIARNLADGNNIAHGLTATPTMVQLTSLNTTYDGVKVLVTWNWTATTATNIVVDIQWVNCTAVGSNAIDVSWFAIYDP